jgi:hypothetical protein
MGVATLPFNCAKGYKSPKRGGKTMRRREFIAGLMFAAAMGPAHAYLALASNAPFNLEEHGARPVPCAA